MSTDVVRLLTDARALYVQTPVVRDGLYDVYPDGFSVPATESSPVLSSTVLLARWCWGLRASTKDVFVQRFVQRAAQTAQGQGVALDGARLSLWLHGVLDVLDAVRCVNLLAPWLPAYAEAVRARWARLVERSPEGSTVRLLREVVQRTPRGATLVRILAGEAPSTTLVAARWLIAQWSTTLTRASLRLAEPADGVSLLATTPREKVVSLWSLVEAGEALPLPVRRVVGSVYSDPFDFGSTGDDALLTRVFDATVSDTRPLYGHAVLGKHAMSEHVAVTPMFLGTRSVAGAVRSRHTQAVFFAAGASESAVSSVCRALGASVRIYEPAAQGITHCGDIPGSFATMRSREVATVAHVRWFREVSGATAVVVPADGRFDRVRHAARVCGLRVWES